MSGSMKGFRCWSRKSVAETVFPDIGTLASDADSLFMAAHTPMVLDHRKGSELGVATSGEAQVLEALTRNIGDLEKNTLVAVTGGAGSGKSHVVRWVHAHLSQDDPRYKILYVPRAVQTLRQLLGRIAGGLPGVDSSDLQSRVDSALSSGKQGEFQARLWSEIKLALQFSIEEGAPHEGETPDEAAAREDRNSLLGRPDEKEGRVNGLADLLQVRAFKDALLRSDGRIDLLVRSYFTETSRRDENIDVFTRDDLPLRERGVLTELRANQELQELWRVIMANPQDALDLLEDALRFALLRATDLRPKGSGDTLDSLFLESRKALRVKKQELILVFEDLAQFGLVDAELYNQLATAPGEVLAPLRVVFAITDGPYARMAPTVRSRVEHEFYVSDSVLSDSKQFIGRYLNLIRVGRDETEELWAAHAGRGDSDKWMLNACDAREAGQPCLHRAKCHQAFGKVSIDGLGEVGLYPYNPQALERAVSRAATRVPEPLTPRRVLDDCISTILSEADVHMGEGKYPHERTRTQFDFEVHTDKDVLLKKNPSTEPERTYRALVIWGDEGPLKEGILEAFSLDVTSAKRQDNDGESSKAENDGGGKSKDLDKPLEQRMRPLMQWRSGDELPDGEADLIRDALCAFVGDRLQLDESLIYVHKGRGKVILDRLLKRTSFYIDGARGQRAGADAVSFDLTRTIGDMRVMAAARWFHDHGHFDPERAKWQWPQGYDPGELMVEFEARLDNWASIVRARFLEITGGPRIALDSVGCRAVALAATGHPTEELGTSSVLGAASAGMLPASAEWVPVDEVASRIISTLRVGEYVAEFASVRQGGGGPQIVDPRDLDNAIQEFLTDPTNALSRVADNDVEHSLAMSARQLLDAITSAYEEHVATTTRDFAAVELLLEGSDPERVGIDAFEVGKFALDEGFFRPSDQWHVFRRHTDFLKSVGSVDGFDTGACQVADVLRNEHLARRASQISESLTFVKNALESTRVECERSKGGSGDLTAVRDKVKEHIEKLAVLVESLGAGG